MIFYVAAEIVTVKRGWLRKTKTPELFSVSIMCNNGADMYVSNSDSRVIKAREIKSLDTDKGYATSIEEMGARIIGFLNFYGGPESTLVYEGNPMQIGLLMKLFCLNVTSHPNLDIVELGATLKLYAGIMPDNAFSLDSDYTLIKEKGVNYVYSIDDKVEMIKSHPRYPVWPDGLPDGVRRKSYRIKLTYAFIGAVLSGYLTHQKLNVQENEL